MVCPRAVPEPGQGRNSRVESRLTQYVERRSASGRRGSLVRLARLVCLAGVGFGALAFSGCSSPAPRPGAAPVELPTHNASDKPALVVIERQGDPRGAIGLAAYLPHGAAALRTIAASAVAALESAGFVASSQVSQDSLLLSVTAQPGSGAAGGWPEVKGIVDRLRNALLTAKLAAPSAAPAPDDPCGFVEPTSGSDDASAAQARAALGFESVALAVVGDAEFTQAVADDYSAAATWPAGERSDDEWPDADRVRAQGGGGRETLSVALRTADGERALSAARLLARRAAGVRTLAQAAGWQLDATSASLRPRGACLHVRLSSDDRGPATEVGALAKALATELQRAVDQATPTSPQREALDASDPSLAAIRAAWTALSGKFEAGPDRFIVSHHTAAPEAADLEKAFESSAPPKLRVVSAVESGQGRIWAALTSPCPTAHEQLSTSGHTAAVFAAAARFGAPSTDRVQLEAWWSERGLALIGSVPSTHPDAAQRLGEALGQSALAAVSDPALVAQTRSALQDGAQAAASWELALRLGSDARPSLLLPYGTFGSLTQFDADRSRDALRGLLEGPATLAVLATDSEQAEAVRKRLAERLMVLRPSEPQDCPAPTKRPGPAPGEYQVDPGFLEDGAAEELATLLYPLSPDDLEAATWVAALLGGREGWLSRAVAEAGLARDVQAHALGLKNGPAALVITLRADPEGLPDAVMQTRALIERLGQRRVIKSDVDRLRKVLARAQNFGDPRQRLLSLQGGPSDDVDVAALGELLRRGLDDQRLIVVRPTGLPTED